MIAGIRSSGCEKRVFRHNDLAHLEELLAEAPADAPKLIAFESVYSMDRRRRSDRRDLRPCRSLPGNHLSRRSSMRSAWTARAAAAFRSVTMSPAG
jgi:hypothetical protein